MINKDRRSATYIPYHPLSHLFWRFFMSASSLFLRMTLALVLFTLATPCLAEETSISREDLGYKVKLRILVDKVMQPEADWVTEEWMVRQSAEAGFNVFSPRRGHDRLDEVRQVTKWCQKYGIYHMPWMRGSLPAPNGNAADGKRLVWANGSEQSLWSPNSDAFWEWTTRYIIEYAKLSAKNRHLMGVFLDYENYAQGKISNLYSLSYDDAILGKFAKHRGIAVPELALDRRKEWLEKQGLHDAFAKFQINSWRARCRALRKAIDRFDPTFQFCIYPAPGTPFMVEAIYPEWATPKAPLILADPRVYGRPSRFQPQVAALDGNRARLLKGMEIPKAAGIPFLYVGGIDPMCQGADPEFCGKNAVMISDVADGYWIFYEGPTYTKQDHADYWKWFTWANRAIAKQAFQCCHEPREMPEEWEAAVLAFIAREARLSLPKVTGTTVAFSSVRLRGNNYVLLICKKGQLVKVSLEHCPVGRSTTNLSWNIRDGRHRMAASGKIGHGQSETVQFMPNESGIHSLRLVADRCAARVQSANVPVGIFTSDQLSVLGGTKRLYFHVPEGMKQFQIQAKGSGQETVRLNVFYPEGTLAVTGQTTVKRNELDLSVPVGRYGGATWSLELARADEGTLEDATVTLDPRFLPVLSFVPKQVFAARGE